MLRSANLLSTSESGQIVKPNDRNLWQALPVVFLLLVGVTMVVTTCNYYESTEGSTPQPRYVDAHGNPLPAKN